MANAKKCDLCGKLYETPICNDVIIIKVALSHFGGRDIDLCDNCYDKLCDFIRPILPKGYTAERRR